MDTRFIRQSHAAPRNPARDFTTREPPGRALFSEAEWVVLARGLRLTRRQAEIARLLCEELTYAGMAIRIGISINTVRMHMRGLLSKLAVRDRLGIVLQLVLAHRRLRGPDQP